MTPFDGGVRFADPGAFALLALVGCVAAIAFLAERRPGGGVLYSSLELFAGVRRSGRARWRWLLFPVRLVAAVLLVIALARPQLTNAAIEVPAEGIDIVLAIDVSSSMTLEGFGGDVSKIDAVKRVVHDFLERQSRDRVGVVVFASEGLVLSPLTLDYSAPQRLIAPLVPGHPVPDGTAIGHGVATGLTLLRESEAKAKAIVLLTDGENNLGDISPLDSAQLARVLGVRLYTIGAVVQGDSIDEQTMKRMSDIAGGRYWRVTDEKALAEVYREIESLEHSRVGTRAVAAAAQDRQLTLLLAAFALLVLEIVLSTTSLRRLP